jgi:hypothetical protein
MHNKCFESKQVAVPRPLIFIVISGKNTATNMRKKPIPSLAAIEITLLNTYIGKKLL